MGLLLVTRDGDEQAATTTTVLDLPPSPLPPTTTTTAPATTTTRRPTTTTTTTPTTGPPPPGTASPPPAGGFPSPDEAAADWAWSRSINYQGDCSFLDSTADYGHDPFCGTFWEDRGDAVVFRIADFPGGDFGFFVLVVQEADGWVVTQWGDDLTGTPPF